MFREKISRAGDFGKVIDMATPNSGHTALLVVHLQHDIISPGTAFGSLFHGEVEARNIVVHCNNAMTAVREAGGLVVPLRIAFEENYSDLNPTMPLLQMVEQAECLKDGSEGAALVSELSVKPDDVILTHQRPGPFTDSDLHEVLRARHIRNVIVCGVATNASVEAAVRQASDLGYNTFVVTDACSAADDAAHEASLASLSLFAQHTTLAELTAGL